MFLLACSGLGKLLEVLDVTLEEDEAQKGNMKKKGHLKHFAKRVMRAVAGTQAMQPKSRAAPGRIADTANTTGQNEKAAIPHPMYMPGAFPPQPPARYPINPYVINPSAMMAAAQLGNSSRLTRRAKPAQATELATNVATTSAGAVGQIPNALTGFQSANVWQHPNAQAMMSRFAPAPMNFMPRPGWPPLPAIGMTNTAAMMRAGAKALYRRSLDRLSR